MGQGQIADVERGQAQTGGKLLDFPTASAPCCLPLCSRSGRMKKTPPPIIRFST